MNRQRNIIILFSLLLAGCSVGPDYFPPEVSTPKQFNARPASQEQAALNLSTWWNTFNDPTLNWLIEETLKSNLDLQLAEARIRETRALVQFSRSDFFPRVLTQGKFSRLGASENARLDVNATDGSTQTSQGDIRDLYETGFDATWEIDIFGGTRRKVEAAQAALQVEIESGRDVLVTLLAEVAQNYITLRSTQRELAITEGNVDVQRETVELQNLRFKAGLANDLTVAQAEAQLRSTAAQAPPLQTLIRQSIHRLSILIGQEPAALQERLLPLAELRQGPPIVPPGLPSELLRRRPDIRRAERVLAATTANIGVAVSDLFPKLDLTGTFGLRSVESGNLFEQGSRYWSFGPTINWDILSWNAVLDNVEVQSARQEQALIEYRKTILLALGDVENTLVAYDREQARYQMLIESGAANKRALEVANQLYNAGVVDFLNVLTSQQAVYRSEDELAQSARSMAGSLVALFKALGGGWDAEVTS